MTAPLKPVVYSDTDPRVTYRQYHRDNLQQARAMAAVGRRDGAFHCLMTAARMRHQFKLWCAYYRTHDVIHIDGIAFRNSGGFRLENAEV